MTEPTRTPETDVFVHYLDDRENGHVHASNSSCFETCPGYTEPSSPSGRSL